MGNQTLESRRNQRPRRNIPWELRSCGARHSGPILVADQHVDQQADEPRQLPQQTESRLSKQPGDPGKPLEIKAARFCIWRFLAYHRKTGAVRCDGDEHVAESGSVQTEPDPRATWQNWSRSPQDFRRPIGNMGGSAKTNFVESRVRKT